MDHSPEDQRLIKARAGDPSDAQPPEGEQVVTPLDAVATRRADLPDIPSELPALPVRSIVIFPGTVVPLTVGREKSKRLIDDVIAGSKLLAVFTQRREEVEDPTINEIYRVGTVCRVLKLLRMPDGNHSLLVHGVIRVGLEQFVGTEPYWKALVNPHDDDSKSSLEIEALSYNARQTAERVIELSPSVPEEASQILRSIEQPGPLADFLAANLSLGVVQKQELLETFDVADRLRKVNATLQSQLEVLTLAHKLQTDVRKEIDKTQREYFLNEQLKAIQRELGETDSRAAELAELRTRLDAAKMPEAVSKEADREFARLARLSPASPETGVIRDYLEWLIEMPWTKESEDRLDIDFAEKVLDADHYGLTKIKRRILEFLAVRKLNPTGRSPILCFAGPPGVGKTSLGQSIARAMNRKFIRIALGGVRDEADIRGHRRTYIGAIPGRLMQEVRKIGVRNPVIMLDEMDKLGTDFRGDPASALLEALDPEQNHSFVDHYLSAPFDLSHALFIGTANYMDPVEPALKDRMEVIDLPGYTMHEKLEIAQRYLVPRQMERNGLKGASVAIGPEVIRSLIEGYTREAGVRNLERSIGAVCRSLAARLARGGPIPESVSTSEVESALGPSRFETERAEREGIPGLATGLAYTPSGGDIIFIEATTMPGRGSFQITGQVGDVMRESAQTALSLIRSRGSAWGVKLHALAERDLHIHVPAGAIPKDGPSAGVAILVALLSLFRGDIVDPSVGMTGEITLRGRVLPIGGVKEKVLAAHRAGLRTVILPKRNEPDLAEAPEDIRKELRFVFASTVEDVIAAAILPAKASVRQPARERRTRRRPPSPKRRRAGHG